MNYAEEMRRTEMEYCLAHAKAVVKHRGEGSDKLVEALALVDVEDEYRARVAALGAFEQSHLDELTRIGDAQTATADISKAQWTANEEARIRWEKKRDPQ